jgi:phosphatidylglycerol:prolipoprotein diacylglycerol transferase
MSPVIFEIGPVSVRWYGLMYVIAIIVGIVLVNREVKRRGLAMSLDDILDFVLITIPIAIICARLYYVIFSWHYYGQNLASIYKIWEGGLAIHGGLIGGAIALIIFSKWKRISFWQFADIISPALVLGQALGRFGNFMNGDAYGTPTDLPWGIIFPSSSPAGTAYRETPIHPTMLYEMTGDLLIFGLLMYLRMKPFRYGFLISMYGILYSALRFVVEFFRGDPLCVLTGTTCTPPPLSDQSTPLPSVSLFESLKVAQIISILIILIFGYIMLRKKLYKQDNPDAPPPAHKTPEQPSTA